MTLWAVLATGESMNQQQADAVRDICKLVAVSDAYRLAPFADVLVSSDKAWWLAHPEALQFKGRKFCSVECDGVEKYNGLPPHRTSHNSGLLGMRVAQHLGATQILLLGFDMRGSHFFGAHPAPLNNTTPSRFKTFLRQFEAWDGCEVINCTPASALTRFPSISLSEALLHGREC